MLALLNLNIKHLLLKVACKIITYTKEKGTLSKQLPKNDTSIKNGTHLVIQLKNKTS